MPAAVCVDNATSGRGLSKLSKALSKLNLRSPSEPDPNSIIHSLRKEQIKQLKLSHSNAPNILSRIPIPSGLTKARLCDYIRGVCITPKGNAFLPQYSEIIPDRLFVSDHFTGTDIATLSRLHITHVVSILHLPNHDFPTLPTVVYHDVVVPSDVYRARSLVATIDDTVDFIDHALRQGDTRVLVHCSMGTQWGPSMVIAWLMRNGHCDYEQARDVVLRKREVINPGIDLERGVKEWLALEMARPLFPLGRGGRYPSQPSPSLHHLTWEVGRGLQEDSESDYSDVIDIK
jgi:Dual specificity phosphatase, catalytic domain